MKGGIKNAQLGARGPIKGFSNSPQGETSRRKDDSFLRDTEKKDKFVEVEMNRQQVVIIVAAALVFCGLCALGTAILLSTRTGQLLVGGVPATPGAPTTSVSGVNAEGFRGPTTAQAKVDIGVDVQRLKTESSAFVRRIVPNRENARCPVGYVCTFHLADGSIKVFVGDGKTYSIQAGTWRFINGYPAGDAVHGNPPCELLRKEQAFGAGEDPSFPVTAGNFTCAGGVSMNGNSAQYTAADVARLIGGANWQLLPNSNGKGWKYNGPSTTFKVPPSGHVDGDGWTMNAGQTSPNPLPSGTVATWWIE